MERSLAPGDGCLSLGNVCDALAQPRPPHLATGAARRGAAAGRARRANRVQVGHALPLTLCARGAQVVAYGISINLVEVTWKSKIKAQFPNPNDYSAFMGDFSSATGAVTFIMMLLSRFIFRKARARAPAAAAAAAAPGAGRRVRRACARGRHCFASRMPGTPRSCSMLTLPEALAEAREARG